MANSPVEELLQELLGAHDRQRTHVTSEPRQARRHARRRAFMIPAALFVFAASAAAAIVIATHRSAPLKGLLPRQLLGSRYALTVAPDLVAGHAGWCVSLLTERARTPVLEDPSYCVSSNGGPLITSGGLVTLSPQMGTVEGSLVEGSLLYAIVNRDVYALRRPDGTRILPIASSDLPPAWKAAVTIQTKPKSHPGTVDTLVPISANGTAYPTTTRGSVVLETVPTSRLRTSGLGCQIVPTRASDLQLSDARMTRGPLRPVPDVEPGFLSCFSANVSVAGSTSTVALLVDAANPHRQPDRLPGSQPLPGAEGIWMSPAVVAAGSQQPETDRLFEKRVGKAWLVLETSASEQAAIAAVDDLEARP